MRSGLALALLFAATAYAANGTAIAATADAALAHDDGIGVPIQADQSPGQERLADAHSELLTGTGRVRLKRLLGAGVFAASGEQFGAVREVLMNGASEPQVIVDAGGRLIEVPWSKLAFDLPGQELHGGVVLPGETRHALDELPEFNPEAASNGG
jgi:hypothetical protein